MRSPVSMPRPAAGSLSMSNVARAAGSSMNKAGGITQGSKVSARYFVKNPQTSKYQVDVAQFNSSNVAMGAYDPCKQVLQLTFKSGRGSVYEYYQVPPYVWKAMRGASSVGRFVYYAVRLRYHYRRIR